jgi:copper transport protein
MRPATLRRVAAVAGIGVALTAAALTVGATAALAAPAAPAARAQQAALSASSAPALPDHAALVTSEPPDGTVVAKAPTKVTATFDQPVAITSSSLEVYAPNGSLASLGNTTHGGADTIQVSIKPGLGNGTYTATWHVISADTHPVQGAFTYSVGAPSATHVGALLPATDEAVSTVYTFVRGFEYAFYAIVGGAGAFLIICWPAGGLRRGVRRLIAWSCGGLFLTTLLALLIQGPYGLNDSLSQLLSPALVQGTLQSHLGTALQIREILCVVAGALAVWLLPRLPTAGQRTRILAAVAWGVLITVIAATWAATDHASTGIQVPLAMPADIIHLDAMAIWIGGLVVLAGFVLRGRASTEVAVAVPRFSAMALSCVAALAATGAYMTWRGVGVWQALVGTTYGLLLVAKIAGMIVLIGLGYLARKYIKCGLLPQAAVSAPSLAAVSTAAATVDTAAGLAGAASANGSPSAAASALAGSPSAGATSAVSRTASLPSVLSWFTVVSGGVSRSCSAAARRAFDRPSAPGLPTMKRLRRSVTIEIIIAAAILGFTAVLVNSPTGREAYGPPASAAMPFNTGGPGGVGIVHMFVTPARLGPNTVQVYFDKPNGHAYNPVQVTAALYFPSQNIGPFPITLTETESGQYRTLNATLTFTGEWQLQVTVRSDAFDETTVYIPLAVHQPA